MTDAQLEREMRYRMVMAVAKTLLARGLITSSEFDDFDRKMADKYSPFLVCLNAKTYVDKI
jgi:histidinol phosphatase-like enzyme